MRRVTSPSDSLISRAKAIDGGLARYFTGALCKAGHAAERITSSRKCVQCNRAWQSKRLASDSDFSAMTLKRLAALDKTSQRNGWAKLANDPAKKRSYRRAAYRRDPMQQVIRGILRRCLIGQKKSAKTEDILGYTVAKLKARLEAQFKPGMSFSNYGAWHVDHKKPVSAFIDKTPRVVNMLCNLQPLWAAENIAKSNTFGLRG